MKRIVVVGGGAAGLMAAVAAARAGASVTLLEAAERVGKKILATGNGRCNLTNTRIQGGDANAPSAACPYNAPAFVAPTLARWGCAEIRAYFAELGLLTVEEREGRVFPASFAANSVLDVLRLSCARYGVETRCNFRAECIDGTAGNFTVRERGGEYVAADAVIVATGGGSKLLSACGHTLVPFEPVLCGLACDDAFRGLSGVRVHAKVTLERDGQSVHRESGEVLFRDNALSGIVIFNMSRHAKPDDTLELDLVPSMGERELGEYLCSLAENAASADADAFIKGSLTTVSGKGRPSPVRDDESESVHTRHPEQRSRAARGASSKDSSQNASRSDAQTSSLAAAPTYAALLTGIVHSRVAAAIFRALGVRGSDMPAGPEAIAQLAHTAKHVRTQLAGPTNTKNAQVTRGGAALAQFDPATLASRLVPGLYAAGEALDVDAACGGFNLHWAWSSALVAAESAMADAL